MYWINHYQDRHMWWPLMNMETGNFLTSYEIINFLERTLLNGVSWLGYSCRKPCTFTYCPFY